jgi:hypothetical protein
MLDVQQLRALCEKATPPPWTADVSEPDDCVVWAAGCVEQCSLVGNVGDTVTPVIQDHEKAQIFFDAEINDCKFIAAAREALPELLDRVEALERVEEAAKRLREVQRMCHVPRQANEGEALLELDTALRDAELEG